MASRGNCPEISPRRENCGCDLEKAPRPGLKMAINSCALLGKGAGLRVMHFSAGKSPWWLVKVWVLNKRLPEKSREQLAFGWHPHPGRDTSKTQEQRSDSYQRDPD